MMRRNRKTKPGKSKQIAVDEEAEGGQEVEGEEVDLGAVAEEVAVEASENPEKTSIDQTSQ